MGGSPFRRTANDPARTACWLPVLLAAGAILAIGPNLARAADGQLRVAVTFPAARSRGAHRRPAVAADLRGHRGRAAAPGQRHREDGAGVRRRRRRLEARRASCRRRHRVRLSAPLAGRAPQGHVPRAGADQSLRDVHPQRRPHASSCRPTRAKASSGRASRATCTPRPSGSRWIRRSGRSADPPGPRPGDPARRRLREAGDEVRQVRADPQRAALEVLGPRHVPGGLGAAAVGLRRPSRRALSAGDQPRALPVASRQLAGDAARPRPQARLQRAVSARRLQPDPAGAGVPVLQGLDRARASRACC